MKDLCFLCKSYSHTPNSNTFIMKHFVVQLAVKKINFQLFFRYMRKRFEGPEKTFQLTWESSI